MLLKDYAKIINSLLPDYGDLETVYSSDDEGNQFGRVFYEPGVVTDIEIFGEEIEEAICVN